MLDRRGLGRVTTCEPNVLISSTLVPFHRVPPNVLLYFSCKTKQRATLGRARTIADLSLLCPARGRSRLHLKTVAFEFGSPLERAVAKVSGRFPSAKVAQRITAVPLYILTTFHLPLPQLPHGSPNSRYWCWCHWSIHSHQNSRVSETSRTQFLSKI